MLSFEEKLVLALDGFEVILEEYDPRKKTEYRLELENAKRRLERIRRQISRMKNDPSYSNEDIMKMMQIQNIYERIVGKLRELMMTYDELATPEKVEVEPSEIVRPKPPPIY